MSRRSTATLVLAAVFAAGVAATLGAVRIIESRDDRPAEFFVRNDARSDRSGRPPGDRPGGPRGERQWSELVRLRVTERLSRTLGLTEEQVAEVREAMERHQAEAERVWEELLPVLAGQRDALNAELADILTAEQYERFQRFLRDDRERGRRSGGRGRR